MMNPEYKDEPYMLELRDKFAINAPPVPDWYKHEATSPRPTLYEVPPYFTEDEREQLAFFLRADDLELSAVGPLVAAFLVKCGEQRKAIREWRDEQRALKFIAWRWAYADMMLEGRAK